MNEHENSETGNPFLILGGAALIALGAGLILSHAGVRRAVTNTLTPLLPDLADPLRAGLARVMPDVDRYTRLREM